MELFWLATTFPVNTTRPSFWRFSSRSASMVTGELRSIPTGPGAPRPPGSPLGSAAFGFAAAAPGAGAAGRGLGANCAHAPEETVRPSAQAIESAAATLQITVAAPGARSGRPRARPE